MNLKVDTQKGKIVAMNPDYVKAYFIINRHDSNQRWAISYTSGDKEHPYCIGAYNSLLNARIEAESTYETGHWNIIEIELPRY